jgi:hypothetical protein
VKYPTLVGYRGFSASDAILSDLDALALNAIRDQAQSLSTSELHGAVVGIGVCSEQSFSLQSLVDLLGVDALSDENDVEAFVNASLEILFADDMSFTPLLPEDDAPLEIRVTAIGEWTGSFVAGLAAGLAEIDLPGDSAAAAGEEATAGEEAEFDLLQVQEFVKIGALLVMSLLNDVPGDTTE